MVNFLHALMVLALATVSVTATASLEATTAQDDPSLTPRVCLTRPSAYDLEKGVDILTDLSCATGGLGCLGPICRACKHDGATYTSELPSCHVIIDRTSGITHGTATASAQTLTNAAADSHGAKNLGLAAIGDKSAEAWELSVGMACVGTIAVAAMAFAAKKLADSRHTNPSPESVSPAGSLVYRRASVFHI